MPEAAASTPLMDQYERVKAQYPGHLVLFRVGDFYETFGDDAKLLARELEVVLTARAPDGRGERMPMAGVPFHAVETYLGRLVQKGHKVALCDQVEDARFARGLIRREVTRVVTPGTVLEDRLLGGADHNFLAIAALNAGAEGFYGAVDITTGEWYHGRSEERGVEGLLSELAAFQPRELLVVPGDSAETIGALFRREFPRSRVEIAPAPLADAEAVPLFREGAPDSPGLEDLDRRLGAYIAATQPRLLPFLERVPRAHGGRRLALDRKTLRHLEVCRPMNPDDPRATTLLDVWDETVTAPGRRTISFWLQNPLADAEAIARRQDAVSGLVDRAADLLTLRQILSSVVDLARVGARLAGRRVRMAELLALRESLGSVGSARDWIERQPGNGRLADIARELSPAPGLVELLARALPDRLPPGEDARPSFRTGFAPPLDRLATEEEALLRALERLERSEQEATGIRSLRIGYNQVFGYYFEVSKPNIARVPERFHRKQTLAGGERYTSEPLTQIETQLSELREARARESAATWERFLAEAERSVPALYRLSRSVGELDALASFALVAQERRLVRPVVDESGVLSIREGRHPVLDRTLSNEFVPNDTELSVDERRLLVLTGPNMSGKSTYMRQVGLLVLLAQAGSFVAARFARVGLVRSLFTRMGFTDDIGRGKSSFLVEMTEVAEILRSADDRSLVLLDEVGRGTSTFDGLAIAWATLRHLHDRSRSRTLVATHYHQLTELVESLPAAANAHLAVREEGPGVVFLHRLVPGSTDRSYGLHVARLAGVPSEVVDQAERLLKRLEADRIDLGAGRRGRASGLRYTQAVLLAGEPLASPLESELRRLDLDRMRPVDALAWLAERKRQLAEAIPRAGSA